MFFDISGSEREDKAAGLGNQSRYKGSIVRGFEPHLPDNMVVVEELVDSPDCESGDFAGSSPVFHPNKRQGGFAKKFLQTSEA